MYKEGRTDSRLSVYKRVIAVVLATVMICSVSMVQFFVSATDDEITFDLAEGSITIGDTYTGYDNLGLVTGTHSNSNKYIVIQSTTTTTNNTITLVGNSNNPIYDVTIDGINCASNTAKADGGIVADALSSTPMTIILRLAGDNHIGRFHYATGEANQVSVSSLYITSALGDGYTDGSLTAVSTVSWSAAIGGIDATDQEASRNITIAGGTITASAQLTSAIGGGGNGYSDVTITGGNITASNNGTGATIGGGGGRSIAGGGGNIIISGGTVVATNRAVNGVAIGAAGSEDASGSHANVTISAGTITANGNIGGGSSISANGGTATINISGGTVTSTGSIGGGNSNLGNGGAANITISGGTITAANVSGGHGFSNSHASGTMEVTGGSAKVDHVCSQLETAVIPYVVTVTSNGTTGVPNAPVSAIDFDPDIDDYGLTDVKTDEHGKLYLWLPSGVSVQSVTLNATVYGSGGVGDIIQQTASIAAPDPIIVGSGLTANLSGGIATTWQWQRYTGSTWMDIANETSSTYTVKSEDVGKQLLVIVNGTYSPSVYVPAPTSFTVTIPESITPASTVDRFYIVGNRYYFTSSQSITVKCSGDFAMELTDSASSTLAYVLYTDSARQHAVTSGGVVATYSGSGSRQTPIYYEILGTPAYAGTYIDTLTFTVTFNNGL